MQPQLNCEQVAALLTYYIENKLSDKMKTFVEIHLSTCKRCNEKYKKLIKIADNYSKISKKIQEPDETESIYHTKQYEDFKLNLSAYIDNELTDEENIRIKKIAISNPIARRDLEDIYTFKRLLHSSFDKTKNDSKEDFTKSVLGQIYSLHTTNKLDPFYVIMTVFAVIIAVALLGVVNIFVA